MKYAKLNSLVSSLTVPLNAKFTSNTRYSEHYRIHVSFKHVRTFESSELEQEQT